jgi:hypothetical protein
MQAAQCIEKVGKKVVPILKAIFMPLFGGVAGLRKKGPKKLCKVNDLQGGAPQALTL